jgi:hypothetical protein
VRQQSCCKPSSRAWNETVGTPGDSPVIAAKSNAEKHRQKGLEFRIEREHNVCIRLLSASVDVENASFEGITPHTF